jgi:hypothetical protein
MSGSIQNKRVKAKILVLSLLVSFFSIAVPQNSNANNGAGVWAVVDSSGTVTNVIVCTQAVCGSGTFGGERVVPQIAPNPITNDAQGQGSFIGNESAGIRVTESNGIFTVHENVRINTSETAVTVDDLTKTTTTTISEVSVPVTSRSFSYNDTIGKTYSEIKLKNESFDENEPTYIFVTKKTAIDDEITRIKSENLTLLKRMTESEITEVARAENALLVIENIVSIVRMLNSWMKIVMETTK